MKIVNIGEHVFIAGRTGSGKTFLVKHYLRNTKNRVYVLDTKKLLDIGNEPDTIYVNSLSDFTKSKKHKTVYQPDWEEMTDDYYNEFFKHCYKEGDCHVWIDELMSIGTASKFPEWYKALMTRGRELGICVWNLTQRPKMIPLVSMSESTHLFIFDLNMIEDRQRLVEVTGRSELFENPGKFVFWYYNTMEDSEPVKGKLTKKGES